MLVDAARLESMCWADLDFAKALLPRQVQLAVCNHSRRALDLAGIGAGLNRLQLVVIIVAEAHELPGHALPDCDDFMAKSPVGNPEQHKHVKRSDVKIISPLVAIAHTTLLSDPKYGPAQFL